MKSKLPEKWYIKVTPENRDMVLDWCDNNKLEGDSEKLYKEISYEEMYIHSSGFDTYYKRGKSMWAHKDDQHEEISTEEFKEYVLKKDISIENYDYLINILTKLDIK